MQVILLEKVANLGNLGDVVRVKDGFARNFLIPQRKARRATETAIADFEARRAELEKVAQEKLSACQAVGEKLKGQLIEIHQKAGVDGRLFGSVTNHDISDCLVQKGHTVNQGKDRDQKSHRQGFGRASPVHQSEVEDVGNAGAGHAENDQCAPSFGAGHHRWHGP